MYITQNQNSHYKQNMKQETVWLGPSSANNMLKLCQVYYFWAIYGNQQVFFITESKHQNENMKIVVQKYILFRRNSLQINKE